MRRTEREMKDRAEMETLLREAAVCRIGLCDGGRPYVVPLTFVYDAGAIFIHSAPVGEKIRILGENPRLCVEVDSIGEVIPAGEPCRSTVSYRSVIAEGKAEWIEEGEEKARALASLVKKYSGQDGVEIPREGRESVVVIRIPLTSMTGKESPDR
jgi:uncharacterized protein